MAVAGLAEELVAVNGLADRVTIHRADARTLAPVEPADLVVGDFLGCFLVDDRMLPAVVAAGRWLKPGGRFCPSRVELMIAPVGDLAPAEIDVFGDDFYGLDLRAAQRYAVAHCQRVNLPPSALLAPAHRYHVYTPPEPLRRASTGPRPSRSARAGRLRGLLGWFVADLAPDVRLSTEPGFETHWGQYLFPIPAIDALPGDVLDVTLALRDGDWYWSGSLVRAGAASPRRRSRSTRRSGSASGSGSGVTELYERGNELYAEGRIAEAIDAWQSAARALTPEDDALAIDLYENLGVALWQLGRWRAASRALLRAFDGDPAREQALRLTVSCAFRDGRVLDGERLLRRYEAGFGEHPEGWKRT